MGDSEVNIIAKSIGTLATTAIIKETIAKKASEFFESANLEEVSDDAMKLSKIILCGIPLNDMNEDEKWNYKILSDYPSEKIIVFQNSEDEHGTFEEVRRFLSEINPNIKVIEKPGSTHNYPYYSEFLEFLSS